MQRNLDSLLCWNTRILHSYASQQFLDVAVDGCCATMRHNNNTLIIIILCNTHNVSHAYYTHII
jgi:hypothetical protein